MLNDIVNKYNNTIHKTIKMRPIEVTGDSHVEYNEDFNKKGPKFKVNNHIRISKYKNIFTADYVLSWQSKGLSNESIKPPTTTNNSLTPELNYYGTNTKVKFIGSCLKQSSHILTHKKVVNIYIVYELAASSSHDSDPTIKNCLFGAVTLTKNANIENYKYSGYGIGFDRRPSF